MSLENYKERMMNFMKRELLATMASAIIISTFSLTLYATVDNQVDRFLGEIGIKASGFLRGSEKKDYNDIESDAFKVVTTSDILKKQIYQDRPLSNQYGIDFSSIEYICSETEKDMVLEKALVKAFDLEQDEGNVRYYYNKVDLNEDGNPEVFVYLVGSPVCGTGGCSAAIFKQVNEEYILLSKFTLVNNPVIINNSKTNGYRDIIMYVSGGGIESFFAWVKYDGTTYPTNPSVQLKVNPGTKLQGITIIADDTSKNPGIELENFSD